MKKKTRPQADGSRSQRAEEIPQRQYTSNGTVLNAADYLTGAAHYRAARELDIFMADNTVLATNLEACKAVAGYRDTFATADAALEAASRDAMSLMAEAVKAARTLAQAIDSGAVQVIGGDV